MKAGNLETELNRSPFPTVRPPGSLLHVFLRVYRWVLEKQLLITWPKEEARDKQDV